MSRCFRKQSLHIGGGYSVSFALSVCRSVGGVRHSREKLRERSRTAGNLSNRLDKICGEIFPQRISRSNVSIC